MEILPKRCMPTIENIEPNNSISTYGSNKIKDSYSMDTRFPSPRLTSRPWRSISWEWSGLRLSFACNKTLINSHGVPLRFQAIRHLALPFLDNLLVTCHFEYRDLFSTHDPTDVIGDHYIHKVLATRNSTCASVGRNSWDFFSTDLISRAVRKISSSCFAKAAASWGGGSHQWPCSFLLRSWPAMY